MIHGYCLRPNAKGRQGRKSADDPAYISSTSANSKSEGEGDITDRPEGGPEAADLGSSTSHGGLPSTHNIQALPKDHGGQRLEAWHQCNITLSTTTTGNGPAEYRVKGPPETSEDIEEGRRRVEARQRVEAVRIQREQLQRHYGQDLHGLHDRIAVLRHECEEEVARARWEWERVHAIERSDGAEAGREEDDGDGKMDCDADDGQSEVDSDCAHPETWSTAAHDDKDDRERRCPARSPPHWSHSDTTNLRALPFEKALPLPQTETPPAPPPPRRLRGSPLLMTGPSGLRRPSHGVQPLRRQQAQLMVMHSFGGHPGTAASSEPDVDAGRTEEDNDSEMGEA